MSPKVDQIVARFKLRAERRRTETMRRHRTTLKRLVDEHHGDLHAVADAYGYEYGYVCELVRKLGLRKGAP